MAPHRSPLVGSLWLDDWSHSVGTDRGGRIAATVNCEVQVDDESSTTRKELATNLLGMRRENLDREIASSSTSAVRRRRTREAVEEMVCVTGQGECYHKPECRIVGAALVCDWNSPRMFSEEGCDLIRVQTPASSAIPPAVHG